MGLEHGLEVRPGLLLGQLGQLDGLLRLLDVLPAALDGPQRLFELGTRPPGLRNLVLLLRVAEGHAGRAAGKLCVFQALLGLLVPSLRHRQLLALCLVLDVDRAVHCIFNLFELRTGGNIRRRLESL